MVCLRLGAGAHAVGWVHLASYEKSVGIKRLKNDSHYDPTLYKEAAKTKNVPDNF